MYGAKVAPVSIPGVPGMSQAFFLLLLFYFLKETCRGWSLRFSNPWDIPVQSTLLQGSTGLPISSSQHCNDVHQPMVGPGWGPSSPAPICLSGLDRLRAFLPVPLPAWPCVPAFELSAWGTVRVVPTIAPPYLGNAQLLPGPGQPRPQ